MIASKRLLATALLAAGVSLYTTSIPAQGAKTAAESLFQTAKQLMAEKKFAEACPKLAESQKLDPSPGTLLNLGRCYEGLGKPASAWAEYKAAAVLAGQLGQKDREQGARDLAKGLEPKLSKLTINAAAVPGMAVKSDGVDLGTAILGTSLFVDPGEHTIEVSAPGYETYTTTVKIGASGDAQTATIPPLVKKPETAPTATGDATSTAPSASPTATTPGEGSGTLRTVSYVLMGVGVASIGVGAVMGGLAASDVGNATSDPTLCPDKVCTPAGREVIDGASTKALVSTIALPVGIAAAGAGVVLFFVGAPKAQKTGSASRFVTVTPVAGPGGAAVSLSGRF